MGKLIGWGIGVLVLITLVVMLSPFTIINAGEVGVVTRVGAFKGTLGPGIHWLTPVTEGVTKFDVQTQKEQTEATAASADLQTVNTTVAVNFNIDPEAVGDLYVRIGSNYKSKVVDPAVQEVVKSVTAKYTAEQLLTRRTEVTHDIQAGLAERLAYYDIIVGASGVSIINFAFSESFNQAIEAKVTAEQNALAAKNKLDQIKYEAQQTVATAQAQAEAIKIQAQAINSQGGADYVALQKVQKWDGHGCTSYCGLESSTGLLVNGK